MEFVPPLTGKSLDDWEATIPARTPPALYGVPDQSFQGMQFGPSATSQYMPVPAAIGIPGRIAALDARQNVLSGDIANARTRLDDALAQYQQEVSQPVQPFQLPEQQRVDPTSAKLGAAAAILAILGGARGQIANQAYGGFLQGQEQRVAQDNQRADQQAMYEYQAGQQARQQRLQGQAVGIKGLENELERLGADFGKNQQQINQLTGQDAVLQQRKEDEAGRNARAKDVNALRAQWEKQKTDPTTKYRMAMAFADEHAGQPGYGSHDEIMRILMADEIYKNESVAHLQRKDEMDLAKLQPMIDEIMSRTALNKLQAEKYAKEVQWFDRTKQADIAKIYADIDNQQFDQQIKSGRFTLDQLQGMQSTLGPQLDDLKAKSAAALERYNKLSDLSLDPNKPDDKRLIQERDDAGEAYLRVSQAQKKLQDRIERIGTAIQSVPAPTRSTVSSKPPKKSGRVTPLEPLVGPIGGRK